MNNKLPVAFRMIFSVALLIIFAVLLTATTVQSADPYDPVLTVEKTVINDNGGTIIDEDAFLLTVDGGSVLSRVPNPFEAGPHTVAETTLPGYAAGDWGGNCDTNGNIELAIYDSKTCTITNDDIPPKLTVIKNVVNDNGGLLNASNFTINVTGIDVSQSPFLGAESPGTTVTLDAGSYSVGETHVLKYSASFSADCSGTIGIGESKTCTITNNDVGFNITPTTGLLTSENGVPTATFTVTLDTLPTANVTLFLTSSNTDEGTIDKSFLTFTPTNWSALQTVTITGVDDFIADGDQVYTIITESVSTSDLDYGALNPVTDIPDISVTNSDNDTPGYTVTPNSDLWVSEGGATETIQVLLKSRPTGQVTLSVQSSNLNEGTVSIANELVNPAIWPQTTSTKITITGVDDCKNGGDSFTVTITATSSDLNYNGTVGVFPVTNYDAPTIGWVEPVGTEGIYYSNGFSPIPLEVESLCPEPIFKVRFYRWVEAIKDWVTIGEDLTSRYQEELLPDELEPGWNQVFAFAFGLPNPIQTFSKHPRILILKDFNFLVHLPLVNK